MFKEIFLFDLRSNFRKPATYIFFGIFFLLTLMLGLALSGVFDVATSDTNIVMNSASAVAGIIVSLNNGILGLVNSVILVAILATAIQKDYEYNTHPLYFTKPITKGGYFFGRFLSGFVTALFVFSAQVIGYYLGSLAGAGKPIMGPYEIGNYLQPFVLFTVPNVLLLGVIFFSITTFTRSTLPAYLFCIVLLALGFITGSMTSDLENKELAALLEPFGMQALNLATEYWTPDEQNHRLIPMDGWVLYNRMLWLGVALLITFISFYRFSFSQFLNPIKLFGRQSSKTTHADNVQLQSLATLPVVQQRFSTRETMRQMLYLAGFEFRKITRSSFFIIMTLLGIITMYIMSQFMGSMYNTETYPVTYQILEIPASFFYLFIMILLVFMSGNQIWREREQKTDELIGTTPVSNSALFFSKYLALMYMVATLLAIICITGILIQLSMGFSAVEPLLYIKHSLRSLVSFSIITGLCLAIQVITPNKYLGFFLTLVPILFIELVFDYLEWNNQLYRFNSSGPTMVYSDMNGFGHTLYTWFLYKGYWLSIIMVLCLIALRYFARGKEKSLKARARLSRHSYPAFYKIALTFFCMFSVSAGAYIYYNTNILHTNKKPKQIEEETVAYEKQYKRYETIPQPRIVDADINVDIFPKQRQLNINGHYFIKNKHALPVDTLFINYLGVENINYQFAKLEPQTKYQLLKDDTKYGVRIFKLAQPMQPGDSIRFDFTIRYEPRGFENGNTETSVIYNGTFFNNLIFPSIGYNADVELSENAARTKYGLPHKPRMAAINDSIARRNNYISHDADWVRFRTTVSTDEDQIAIAPGYLKKEWKEKGRRYFSYEMDSPILNFYAYLSARYEVKREQWNDVNIEVYYHKGHEYNLDRMIKSVKKSLDYYTNNFGPYQHRQVRILEFPRYNSFAQSFPNTIPYSESIGFITKVDTANEDKIDVPFYVTAHEIAHQWWAHQVIGGNVQGSVLMSETMSQYSALMVMEKEYGRQAMKKFLQYEMDDYLSGRRSESKKEVPLMLCENQGYIHYAKGSVIMYSLRDYLGEDVLNGAIRTYLEKYKYQEPPYTNAIEFVDVLRSATPDSLKYLITDMFETITIFENYVKSLSYTKTEDGKYKVKLTVGSAKFRADSLGKQHKIPVADYIDIGVFAKRKNTKQDKELIFKKFKMDQPEKTFEFLVTEEPYAAGIDPYRKLIDRKPKNNYCKFGETPESASTDINDNEVSGNITIRVGDD
jgi:ABC-2 type transport system permease protein